MDLQFTSVLTVLILISTGGWCVNDNAQYRLITDLLSEYDPDVRPVKDWGQPIILTFDVAFSQILDLDVKAQALQTSVWVRMYWNDVNLVWNPENYSNIESVTIGARRIWKPDITLYNSVQESPQDYLSFYPPSIQWNGDVAWLVPRIYWTSCTLDLAYFPWDHQYCRFQFASWGFDGTKLDIFNKTAVADVAAYVPHGEWLLTGTSVEKIVAYYGCCPEPFPSLLYTLRLKRKSLYYSINVIFPSACIAGTAIWMFLVPPESGEKLSLAVTLMLSSTVFLMVVVDMLPVQSDTIPALSAYCCQLIVLMAAGTAGEALVVHIHYKGTYTKKVPNWLHICVLHWLAPLICGFTWRCQKKTCTKRRQKLTYETGGTDWDPIREKRTAGLAILTGKSVHFASLTKPGKAHVQNGNIYGDVSIRDWSAYGNAGADTGGLPNGENETESEELKYNNSRNEDISDREEWFIIAHMLDRLFFILYILGFIIAFIRLYALQ